MATFLADAVLLKKNPYRRGVSLNVGGFVRRGAMKTLCMLALVLCATGCSMVGKSYRPDALSPKYDWYDQEKQIVNIDALLKSSNACLATTEIPQTTTIVSPAVSAESTVTYTCMRQSRDRAINSLMTLSDELCTVHLSNIVSNANAWNVTTGSITNVLAGVAALGTNSAVQANYAAGALFSNSTRSLVNSEIYTQSLATTIVRAIDNLRNDRRDNIEERLKTQDENIYTFENAFRDVQRYHDGCSFYVGVSEVSKAVANRTDQSESVQLSVLKLQALRNTLLNNGHDRQDAAIKKIDEQIAAQIQRMNTIEK